MKNKKNKNKETNWILTITFLAFFITIIFSLGAQSILESVNIFVGIIIILLFIFIGIIFDIVAVAVTVGNEDDFHAKATKKVKGSKTALNLIKQSAKVANVCADVIGDICGVLSGAISATIAMKIMAQFTLPFDMQFIISAIVASLTVGGKAVGKTIAQEHSTSIIHIVSKILSVFSKNK